MCIIICPYCKSDLLQSEEKSFTCENRHNFDVAKEGYINLLPVNQKKSKEPGDNQMMVAARRNFLERGFYDPLIENIKEVISKKHLFTKRDIIALDAGCGEGYYSEKVLNKLDGINSKVLGTDISKSAIKIAAKKYKNNFYFVSSINNLPITSDSIDLVLSVFSPIKPEEFKRILSKNGYVVIISPGPNHLNEIAELIYDYVRPHTNNIEEKMAAQFKNFLSVKSNFKVEIQSSEDLLSLLKMTPYYWSTGTEKLEKITKKAKLSVSCDFNIDLFCHKKEVL